MLASLFGADLRWEKLNCDNLGGATELQGANLTECLWMVQIFLKRSMI